VFPDEFIRIFATKQNIKSFSLGFFHRFAHLSNLAEAIRTNKTHLKKLRVPFTSRVTKQSQLEFLEALIVNTTLQDVSIAQIKLDVDPYPLLTRLIRENTTLKKLIASNIVVIDECTQEAADLFKAISQNETITELDFFGNLNYYGLRNSYPEFFEALNSNRSLKRLKLIIPPQLVPPEAISTNHTLLRITVDHNGTECVDLKKITDRNSHNRALGKASLSSLFLI
jgi:hypothetical protein